MAEDKKPMDPLGFWGVALWFTGFSGVVSGFVFSVAGIVFYGDNTRAWPGIPLNVGLQFMTLLVMLFISVFATAKIAWSQGRESVQGRIFYDPNQLDPGQYQVVGGGKVEHDGDKYGHVVFVRPNGANKYSAPLAFFSRLLPSGTVLIVKRSEGIPGVRLPSIEVEYLNPI